MAADKRRIVERPERDCSTTHLRVAVESMALKAIGFAGTDGNMTTAQLSQVQLWLEDLKKRGATDAHHGMCIGSDVEFHARATAAGYRTVGHPGVDARGQAARRSAVCPCDEVLPERAFLHRNFDIVLASDVMIAAPAQAESQARGSESWTTIRYARRIKRLLCLVNPDGTVQWWKGDESPTLIPDAATAETGARRYAAVWKRLVSGIRR